MEAIRKPGPRKQEMLNKFFWLRTFLLTAEVTGKPLPKSLPAGSGLHVAIIETVWNAQTAYVQADDDDYNYNVALETYQMLENGLMEAGIDIDAGIQAAMQRNGYSSFKQMKQQRVIPDDFFELKESEKVGAGKGRDSWDL